jgi:methylamine dehydrogenase accessory protein MauD
VETVLLVSSVLLWIVLLGNVLLTLALVRNANKVTARGNPMALPEGLKEGTEAPEFQAQALDETTVTLDDYRQKAALFVFVAPHCGACENILPSLNTMGPQMRETELVLVCDGTVEQARALAKEHSITLPLLSAPRQTNSFFTDYKIHGTPNYYLINAQGQIQAAGIPHANNGQWTQLVASLTKQGAPV